MEVTRIGLPWARVPLSSPMWGSCLESTLAFSSRAPIQPRWGLCRWQAQCRRNEKNKFLPRETPLPIPTQGLDLALLRETGTVFLRNKYNSTKIIIDGLCARTSSADFRKLLYHWDSPTDKKNLPSILRGTERIPNTGFCSRPRSQSSGIVQEGEGENESPQPEMQATRRDAPARTGAPNATGQGAAQLGASGE